MSDWIKKLKQLEEKKGVLPIGHDWCTMREWQAKLGFGDNKTRKYLRKAVEEGYGKVFIGLQKNTCGILCRQVWYKLK